MSQITVTPESVEVGGRARTMTVVHRPRTAAGPVPVVLVFHGSMQTASAIRAFTANSLDEIGARVGAVVAYLDGHKKHWNDARIVNSPAARSAGVDDVAFAKAAIDLVVSRYGGDRAQVYAVGFSNGGQMVIRLIHEIPSALAGAAVLSATQTPSDNFAPHDPRDEAVPVMFVHGTKDPIVPYAGGMAKMLRISPRGIGMSAPESAAFYARRNGITASPVTRPLGADGARPTWTESTDYRQPGRRPVTLYTVHGGGHTIPVRTKGRPHILTRAIMGATDRTLDTSQAISEFFDLTARDRQV